MITVILNAFKRQRFLIDQIESVLSQSIPVDKILIWNNGPPLALSDYNGKVIVANSSENFGVWSRFAFALNADTEYVCILDDDTFPNEDFFKSCVEQMDVEPALLGCRGLRFLSSSRYQPFETFGWDAPNEKAEVVDIVGHAWFFKKIWLSTFWLEQPKVGASRIVGEDMHFSFMLQKHLGLKTMVPAHSIHNKKRWGSDPEIAIKLGSSKEAISQADDVLRKFDLALKNYTSAGFVLCKDSVEIKVSGLVIGPGISRIDFIKRLANKYSTFDKFARKIQKKLKEMGLYI